MLGRAHADRCPDPQSQCRGLHLYVTPAGGKVWRLRYEFQRKEKLLSIGPYPSVGVADAREAATTATPAGGERDPTVEKRLRRLEVGSNSSRLLKGYRRKTSWNVPSRRHRPDHSRSFPYDAAHQAKTGRLADSAPIRRTAADCFTASQQRS
jgi:hypothetical protein